MEDIIKSVISKKLRKRGESYDLSENSKSASADFIYANKITSKLFQYAKRTWPTIVDRKGFSRLLKLVVQLMRMDEVHELGQLRIGYGNVSSLVGFRWNKLKSFNNLLHWSADVGYAHVDRQLVVTIPAYANYSFTRYDERIHSFCVQYHVICLPFELKEEQCFLSSKVLELEVYKDTPSRETKFTIPPNENCLLIVMESARCKFKAKTGDDVFLTSNTSFNAADVVAVFRILNGELMQDVVREQVVEKVEVQDEGSDWV